MSDRMRERVLQSVDALGYSVNLQARSLAGGASRTILMVFGSDVGSEPNSYYQSALEIGALRAASRLGLELVTHNLVNDAPGADDHVLELMNAGHKAGLILTPPYSDHASLIRKLEQSGHAVICISPGPGPELAPAVSMDDEAAGFALAEHLLELGHRRFGFIKGRAEHLAAEERHRGVLRALVQAGLAQTAVTTLRGDFTFKAGVDLLPELVALVPHPTAIICANDDMGVGALFAAHRLGLDVPGDISIASFDDTPVSALVWPPLTTVHQPIQDMSARAVEMIALSTTGASAARTREYLPFRIVMRGSTATPADAFRAELGQDILQHISTGIPNT